MLWWGTSCLAKSSFATTRPYALALSVTGLILMAIMLVGACRPI
jgi:hypothetical protein